MLADTGNAKLAANALSMNARRDQRRRDAGGTRTTAPPSIALRTPPCYWRRAKGKESGAVVRLTASCCWDEYRTKVLSSQVAG